MSSDSVFLKSFYRRFICLLLAVVFQDPFQDSWNRGGSYESSRASSRVPSGASENLRKTSSATNIVDDLSSIFGGILSYSPVTMHSLLYNF